MARVMVVEDERAVAEDIERTLIDLGHDVPRVLSRGEDAVTAAADVQPQLILMDLLLLGDMDGIEAAARIRQDMDIPVIFLTGHANDEQVDRAKQVAPYGYLIKPYDGKDLHSAIEIALFRHALERQNRAREHWLSTTLCSIGDAVVTVDPDGHITFMNPIAEFLTGWSTTEAIGLTIDLVFRVFDERERHPLPNPALRALKDRASVGGSGPAMLRSRDGGEIPIDDSAAAIIDEHGGLMGAVLVFRDVTSRRQLETRLAVSSRLGALGTLTAGIAHEINNPMAYNLANVEWALEELDDLMKLLGTAAEAIPGPNGHTAASHLDNLRQALTDAHEGGERVRSTVADLANFARPSDGARQPVALTQILDAAIRMSWTEIRHRADLVTDFRCDPHVLGNDVQLAQVFTHLLSNAAHAIDEGGNDKREIKVSIAPGDHESIAVEVSDTGAGMTPEVMVRIFEPFFTTKPLGMGSGLGLAMCYGIVAAHKGEISVRSTPGSGSTFRVTLPIASPATAKHEGRQLPRSTRRLRILVIDDEESICTVVHRSLRGQHEVAVAMSVREALDTLATQTFDVILCDLMMPGMTGADLHQHLETNRPDLARRILFMTGGAFTERTRAFMERVMERCIMKPFRSRELLARIDRFVISSSEDSSNSS